MARRRVKLKKKYNKILVLIFIIMTAFISYKIIKINDVSFLEDITKKENKENDDKLYEDYTNCLKQKYKEDELNETLQTKIDELSSLLSKYHVSVGYEDIMTGFKYDYNSKSIYYAASTIKILDAIYAIDKYLSGEIDINTKIVFKSTYNIPNSPFLNKQKIGSYISIKDLIKNAIMFSDNGAHLMLYDYFGYNNLKSYANSLGAINTYIGDKYYGNISTNDALIYIKKLDELINKDKELGEEIKSWFIESSENYIKTESIPAAVKYGGYNEYFHNVGIVYSTNPYYLVILSANGNGKSKSMIKEISLKVQELHELFYSNRQEYCTFEVYN